MTRHRKRKAFPASLLAAGAIVLATTPASAHHAMGGRLPTNLLHGLLSGLGHPVIGVDHLAFILAVGVASAFLAARYALPAIFIIATVAGCLVRSRTGIELPMIEVAVAGSLLLAGAFVMSGARMHVGVWAMLFGAGGLYHGAAYAAGIIGAETTPLLAYLAGFSLVQYAIAVGAIWLVRSVWHATSSLAVEPRLAGALVAGIGAALMAERLEAMVFPGI
jgi:urease accessory protein